MWVKATSVRKPIFLNLSAIKALEPNSDGTTTIRFIDDSSTVVAEDPNVLLRSAKEIGGRWN